MAAPSVSFSLANLSPQTKFVGLTAVMLALVALSYLMKVFPDWVGSASIGSFIPTALYFVAHGLDEDSRQKGQSPKNGMPAWSTFIVVTVGSALVGAVGYFVLSNGTLEVSAALTWLIVVLGAVFHSIAEDKGSSVPETTEAWATAILGIAIGLLGFYSSNPTAGASAWIATLTMVVPQYIHITSDGSSVTVAPVTNPPPPQTPPAPATS